MSKKIIIIHSSEIIRKGIKTILRNYFNIEYIHLPSFKDILEYKVQFQNQTIIMFIEYSGTMDLSHIYNLKEYNQVDTIGVCNKLNDENEVHGFDHYISLKSGATEISNLVADIIDKSENQSKKKIENDELSIREKDVLKLVALGNTNKEIAEKLFISIHTVISHRKNITEKLGIKSISGLTVYAILNKLIDTNSIDIEQLI